MKEHEKYDAKRRQADEENLRRAMQERAEGRKLSPEEKNRMIRDQERQVHKELRRLRDKENPRINGRRGRMRFSNMPSRPPMRRINVRRKR